MPIHSITGKPGNGKTCFMVKRIMAEAAKAERPLWASGIDGLQPGLCNTFKDPREWNAVKPGETCTCHDTENSDACGAHVIPNGSLIFIDEAWKWFGHLQNASRQTTPPHVLELAEHRHRGIDFVWTYQQPAQIYPFARGLMAEHQHLVRKYGTQYCDSYVWQELCEDVKSSPNREAAQRSTVRIPSEVFDKFKSAEVHTIKRKLPAKLLALPVVLLLAVASIAFAVNRLKPDAMKESITGKEADAASAAPASSAGAERKGFRYASAMEYAQAMTPRIESMPWTAPAFDGRSVVSEPRVFCSYAGAGLDANGTHLGESCHCRTEQGTLYRMDETACRNLARNGEGYNPFRQPQQEPERVVTGAGQRPAVMDANASARPPQAHASRSTTPVAGYGEFGAGG